MFGQACFRSERSCFTEAATGCSPGSESPSDSHLRASRTAVKPVRGHVGRSGRLDRLLRRMPAAGCRDTWCLVHDATLERQFVMTAIVLRRETTRLGNRVRELDRVGTSGGPPN